MACEQWRLFHYYLFSPFAAESIFVPVSFWTNLFLHLGILVMILNFLSSNSDHNLLSSYGITILANTLVMRIKEMVIEREIS